MFIRFPAIVAEWVVLRSLASSLKNEKSRARFAPTIGSPEIGLDITSP